MKTFVIGAALAFFAVGAANATVYTQTWTGTVKNGVDSANLFGGGSLTGQAFVATYVFDDAVGAFGNNGIEHYARGGSVYPSATPNLSTSLTIGGLTYAFVGTVYGEIYSDYEASFSYLSSIARNDTASLSNTVYDAFSAAYAAPAFDYSGGVATTLGNSGQFRFGGETLNFTNLTYAVAANAVADVPEPAAWAMFIGGFGLVGAAMRRTRTAVRFA